MDIEQAERDAVPNFDEEVQDVDDIPEAPGKNRIEKFRAIVRERSIMCIEGQPVDLFSASNVVALYDALSKPESRHMLMSFLDIRKVVDITFKTLKRSQEKKS